MLRRELREREECPAGEGFGAAVVLARLSRRVAQALTREGQRIVRPESQLLLERRTPREVRLWSRSIEYCARTASGIDRSTPPAKLSKMQGD